MSTGESGDVAPEGPVQITLRPIASSLPLGFFAFCGGTVLLTALEAGWVPPADGRPLMVMVLAFVVPLEVLAGVFAFLARDSGAATGLTLLGAAWAATAITVASGPPGALSPPLAIFLLTLTPMMFAMFAASLSAKPLFGLLLLAGGCRFALTGIYEVTGIAGIEKSAGWLGIPLAAFALYGGLALLLEEGKQRSVLPVGRRGMARTSLDGDLGHQIRKASQEPGVRRQL